MLPVSVLYIVLALSSATYKQAGFGVDSACRDAQELEGKGGSRVFKVTRTPSNFTYAIICNAPGCATPPDNIDVAKVQCALIPEKKTVATVESVEPEHWEAR